MWRYGGMNVEKLSDGNKLVDVFVEHLSTIRVDSKGVPDIARLGGLWNGFEGWLKAELVLVLEKRFGKKPWEFTSQGGWQPHSVGVEYKAVLKPERGDSPKYKSKRVDTWTTLVGDEEAYVELKVVFNNDNVRKQIKSWTSDWKKLQCIERTDNQTPKSVVALLIAVGFKDGELLNYVNEQVANQKQLRCGDIFPLPEPKTPADGEILRRIDYACLVHDVG